MDTGWKNSLWNQFGAAIDMLESALTACPEELWRSRSQQQEFWYEIYHCLFWLDLYLSGSVEGFAPPAPFGLEELDPAGLLPERPYTKNELRAYLEHGREKCRATIESLTDAKARRSCKFPWGEVSFLELLLYNLRHVQGHAAELLWILGEKTGAAPGWVGRAKGGGGGK